MTMESSVSKAVRRGLIFSSMAAISATPVAMADESAAAEDVERISVTGSRIKRADMETASPVTVIDASSIKAEGYTSIDEVLQNQPAMAGMAVGSTTNNGADGVAQVDLRGMGAERTLVLLNGRRMVNSGSGADSAVDLNAIPVAMIQRIEVLKDGASAVYGSDAIAGVVNIITKKDFEGFSFDLNGDITEEGDGENVELAGLYGFSTDNGNYTIGMSVTDRSETGQADRDWVPEGASSFVPGGNLGGAIPDGNGGWKERDIAYDYTETSYLQTPSTKYSLFANMVQNLDNDMTFNGDVLYTHRDSNQQMAPEPAKMYLNVCDDANADPTANCFDLTQDMIDAGVTPNDDGQVEYRRRMVGVGPRIYEQKTDTMRVSAALAGYLDLGTGMDWEVSYTYGRNRADTKVENAINATKMSESIYANPADWFSGDEADIEQYLTDVAFVEDSKGGNDQHTVSAVLSGELMELPAGVAGFAIGAEYRFEKGFYTPDEVVRAGDSSSAQTQSTKGDYDVISVYQELSVPFTDKLSGEFALRYDDYSTFGDAATWKVGLTYQASDELMLRAVAATGFRAPTVSELYGGDSASFEYLSDPWGNAQDPQIEVKWTSDEDLTAEESDSLTLGMVYSPEYVDGLSFTVDYWAFDVSNAIARRDVQQGLTDCFNGDSAQCEYFNITPSGDLRNLTNALTNVGTQKTEGIDFNAQYRFEAAGLDWSINNDLVYLIKFEQDGNDYTGEISGTYGAYAEFKNQFTINARHDRFAVNYSNRFIDGMDDVLVWQGVTYSDSVDSILYHNLSGSYFVNDQVTVTAGVRNLTDEDPIPVLNSGNDAGTVPEVYETLGRTYFAGVNIRF